VASLVTKINGVAALGITANAPGGGTGGIYLQSNAVGTSITTPGTNTLASAVAFAAPSAITGATGATGNAAVTTVGPASGTVNTGDTLTGGISIINGGVTDNFVMGAGTNVTSGASHTYYTANSGDGSSTLANLAATIQADHTRLGLASTGGAVASTGGLTLTSGIETGNITTSGNTLADTTQGTYSTDTMDTFASVNDTVAGSLSFSVGGVAKNLTLANGSTVQNMVSQINQASLGVTASLVAGSNGWESVKLTSNTEGTAGNITATSGTSVSDTTATASLSYTAAGAYNMGISGAVSDSTSAQSAAAFASNVKASSGVATISYTDAAGVSLSATDLSNQTDAKGALTLLNAAITDVAAQDGYIGAQINTLNAVSQVLTTQQENVKSAQNAVQATDYASAASNMSKYEILSQTGIAALAQANSVQQEVTKLLQ
jgi:flagellin